MGEAQGALGEQQGALERQMGELRWNLQNLKVDLPDLTAQMQDLREKVTGTAPGAERERLGGGTEQRGRKWKNRSPRRSAKMAGHRRYGGAFHVSATMEKQ